MLIHGPCICVPMDIFTVKGIWICDYKSCSQIDSSVDMDNLTLVLFGKSAGNRGFCSKYRGSCRFSIAPIPLIYKCQHWIIDPKTVAIWILNPTSKWVVL